MEIHRASKVTEDDLTAHATATIRAKGLALEASTLLALKEKIADSLTRIYKSIAIDIDETATSRLETESEGIAALISQYADSGIHVLVITGRGRRGAEAYIKKYLTAGFPRNAMAQVDVICHHAGFYVNLEECYQASSLENVPWSHLQVRPGEDPRLKRAALDMKSHPTLSSLEWTQEPFSLRIHNPSDQAVHYIEAIARECRLNVSRGVYSGVNIVDLKAVTKADALSWWSKLRGVAVSSILRIGDMGAEGGADYEMLDSESGFTVGEASINPDKCFAIGSPGSGEQMTGAAATRQLLENAILYPPIALSVKRRDDRMMKHFYSMQKNARRRGSIEWKRIGQQFSLMVSRVCGKEHQMDAQEAILDFFDPRSGAVRVRDEESLEISKSYAALASFFAVDRLARQEIGGEIYARAMYADASILLRGREYYGEMTQEFRDGQTTISSFVSSRVSVLRELLEVSFQLPRPSSSVDLKLVLGAVDYTRQCILQSLQALFWLLDNAAVKSDARYLFGRTYKILVTIQRVFTEICLEPCAAWEIWGQKFTECIRDSYLMLEEIEGPDYIASCQVPSKHLFHWREADWPLESLAAVKLVLEKVLTSHSRANRPVFLGLAYGGIELPSIATALAERVGVESSSAVLRISHYDNHANGAVVRKLGPTVARELAENIEIYSSEGVAQLKGREVVLLDDNITTGFSLEVARDVVVYKGGIPKGAGIVRYVGANRWHHLCKQDHAMVSPQMMFTFVRGLISTSPYSRILGNYDGDASYVDELGTFDKAKDRIVRLLTIKNPPSVP